MRICNLAEYIISVSEISESKYDEICIGNEPISTRDSKTYT